MTPAMSCSIRKGNAVLEPVPRSIGRPSSLAFIQSLSVFIGTLLMRDAKPNLPLQTVSNEFHTSAFSSGLYFLLTHFA